MEFTFSWVPCSGFDTDCDKLIYASSEVENPLCGECVDKVTAESQRLFQEHVEDCTVPDCVQCNPF